MYTNVDGLQILCSDEEVSRDGVHLMMKKASDRWAAVPRWMWAAVIVVHGASDASANGSVPSTKPFLHRCCHRGRRHLSFSGLSWDTPLIDRVATTTGALRSLGNLPFNHFLLSSVLVTTIYHQETRRRSSENQRCSDLPSWQEHWQRMLQNKSLSSVDGCTSAAFFQRAPRETTVENNSHQHPS